VFCRFISISILKGNAPISGSKPANILAETNNIIGADGASHLSDLLLTKDHVFSGKFDPIGSLDENFGVRDLGASLKRQHCVAIVVIS
jgi:hypothetical protein